MAEVSEAFITTLYTFGAFALFGVIIYTIWAGTNDRDTH